MNLHDQMAADVAAIFLNPDECGETRTIDGAEVICILESDTAGEFAGVDAADLAYVATKRLYVRDGALAAEPRQGRLITIDGRPYTCLAIAREEGLLILTLTEQAPA